MCKYKECFCLKGKYKITIPSTVLTVSGSQGIISAFSRHPFVLQVTKIWESIYFL